MAPNQKRFVLKLANYCECDGCHKTLKKLKEIDGVHSTTLIDAKTWEFTVFGPVDPQKVIKFLEKKGKKAKLVTEEIQPKRNNRPNAQIITLPAVSMPQPVVQGFKGLKQLEVTHSKNVTFTFNGKNIDEVTTRSDTRIKMVMDDDRYREHGTGTSFGGQSATPWQGSYFPLQELRPVAGYEPSAPPWQGSYFPLQELRPVAGYEPPAPPLSRQVWVMRKV